MSKHVKFIPSSEDVYDLIDPPQRSSLYMPLWLKKIPDLPFPNQDSPKKCMPFIDTFCTGYVQELICDVSFKYMGKDEQGNDIVNYMYSGSLRPLSSRKERTGSNNMLPRFDGLYNAEFAWSSVWEPETPAGYSTFYSHPQNRPDLPFYTFSGIIDTDVYPVHGPVPFLLKEGFDGIIPAGTPIYQIFFIKREKWISSKEKYVKNFTSKISYKAKRYFTGGYKKLFWNKKEYL